jgi:hypothetical protein
VGKKSNLLSLSPRLVFGPRARRERAQDAAAVSAGDGANAHGYYLDRHVLPALRKRRLQELNTDAAVRLIASLRAKGLARRRSLARASTRVPLGHILALALWRGYITDRHAAAARSEHAAADQPPRAAFDSILESSDLAESMPPSLTAPPATAHAEQGVSCG